MTDAEKEKAARKIAEMAMQWVFGIIATNETGFYNTVMKILNGEEIIYGN